MLEFMDLSFTLNGAAQTLSKQLRSYTGREVQIDGDIKLTLSFSPQLLVKRIHIKNPDDFDNEDFITISQAQIEVQLLPLLYGQVYVNDFSADQATIKLHQNTDGSNNWIFTGKAEQRLDTDEPTKDSETGTRGIDRISLEIFNLTNVSIQYRDDMRQQVINKQLDQLLIDTSDHHNPVAEISGNIQGHPYSFNFKSETPVLANNGQAWVTYGKGQVANRETNIESRISFEEDTFNIDAHIDVTDVDLGRLLEELEIIPGQDAATANVNIAVKSQGSDLAELYEHIEITTRLGEGYWNFQSSEDGQQKRLSYDSASSYTSWKKPLELHMDGSIAGETVKVDLISNPLQEFFDDIQTIDIDLRSTLADTSVSMKGTLDLPIKTKQFNLDISIRGHDLEKLNPIIDTEFPPFNNYRLTGSFIANKKGYVIKSANASIGSTRLQSSIVIQTNLAKPHWIINLSSEQLQLKDFAFDDWSTSQVTASPAETTKPNIDKRKIGKPLRQLEAIARDPDMLLDLNLNVGRLLSGEDVLGKARLQLHLHDNAISVENADIEIPGGRIQASLSFVLEDGEAGGHAKIDIEKLDYGITTRLLQPESKIDGMMSMRVDLQLGGRDFTRLLDSATGNIDVVVWPKNTRPAKALNLWTTNLYLILLPELKKKESLVNCMVGLMNLEDGMMKEEFFAIDTTKLWIYGNITVNFKLEQVRLSLFPQSKTARLFSLQSPIRAEGSFSDIDMAINPIDLTGSYISFITSPLHVPTRWIFGDKVPDDGSAVCEQFFDRNYVQNLNAEIREKEKKEINELLDDD
jgi:uncharacterized protein involved in outer membrane biogenesis